MLTAFTLWKELKKDGVNKQKCGLLIETYLHTIGGVKKTKICFINRKQFKKMEFSLHHLNISISQAHPNNQSTKCIHVLVPQYGSRGLGFGL